MPVQDLNRDAIESVIIANPNSRFATTFISNKYRKHAVNGETLQDKATGEIFTKRPADGRVVSFFQNKKYMHDLMMELKVLLISNDSFIYPDRTHENAFYLSRDYDIMTINNDEENDISQNDTTIPSDDVLFHNITFPISYISNGFFCRLTSRDSDKAAINWLTNKYDTKVREYTGTDPEYIAEKEKFDGIPKWKDSNAKINYTVILTKKDTGEKEYYPISDYIHINEEYCIRIPDSVVGLYFNNTNVSVMVKVNKIEYGKIHFILTHMNAEEIAEYNKFIYPDGKLLATYFNVMNFIDTPSDIVITNNEFIVAMVDVPYCMNYIGKIGKIVEQEPMKLILSPQRPGDDTWKQGGIWAESVRHVFSGGVVVNTGSDTLIEQLEQLISDSTDKDTIYPFVTVSPENGG